MNAKTFVDTNVLIYAHDVDAQTKHEIARGILRELWSLRTGSFRQRDKLKESEKDQVIVVNRELFVADRKK